MHIVIGCGAMSFGPMTPMVKSLGGSETAALELSKALARAGHKVELFCILPPPTAPDAWPSGKELDGVIYRHVSEFGDYVAVTEHDLTIGVRDPQFMSLVSKAKKKVLWAHDIFTKRGMQRALDQMGWCFDEIWCVSEWHRQQIHEATGYPLDHIVALRNGIVRYDDVQTIDRSSRHLIYASRPERGLDNLIKPGGVMDHLPEFTLSVAMYEHFPAHMKPYYDQIFARMKEMSNVEYIGGKPNHVLRQIIADSGAYVYPTQFEETSCILARECIEQRTPFITTRVGALPETLGTCGVFFEDWLAANGIAEPERGSNGWCKLFAHFFREAFNNKQIMENLLVEMTKRDDLYWDGVVPMVEAHQRPQIVGDQTIGAAIIAYNNEDTILKCLNSLVKNVDEVHIALGPCTDQTPNIIAQWSSEHPSIRLNILKAPKIEARKFGFDDARNLSVSQLHTDWVLWIDTDEYLVGNLRPYARNSHIQSYMISQHHFTVEPRGAAPQIDRPARMFRNGIGFVARGHIHEHFELMPEGGPGRAYLMHDVDIGHTGYVNEAVRKDRFDRNWPFLQWEHEEPEQRKLNHFLWFRDIIHRMRWEYRNDHPEEALKLAHDAENYYNSHQGDMGAFGPGVHMALGYLSEAYTILGKGVPLRVAIKMDDRSVVLEGLFESYEQMERVIAQMLKPEFEDRSSRYY